MAKLINGLLGNSRNKIGSIVTYVAKGQQIARSKAANISNPRTASQMSQRIKLSNVVAMYRANKNWMDRYAFENKPTRWSVFNAFVSANLSASLVALTKQEAAAGACVAAPYKMTDGSLPQIQINELAGDGTYATDLYIGSLVIGSATTVGELSSALIANNNGIVQGMQLSLIENVQEVVNNIPRVVVRAYEFIVNSTDTTPLADRWGSAGLTTHEGETGNTIAYSTMQGESAFTFVLSHTYGGKTHVGASYMVLNDPAVYDSYTSSTAISLAIQSYGSADETPFLDSTEQQSGSNAGVDINPTILQFAGKNPGAYLGAPTSFLSAANDTTLLLSKNAEVESVTARVQGTNYDSESVDAMGTAGTFNVTFGASFAALKNPVIAIVVTFAGGTTVSASFAESENDSGVTE